MKKLLCLGLAALSVCAAGPARSQQPVIQGIMGMMQQMAIEAQRQQQMRGRVQDPGARLTPETVRTIQFWLVWTGYYPGPLDGDMGDGTKEGIKRFQRDIGHSATGLLTNQQATILSERTSRIVRDLDYKGFTDPVSGVQVGIPRTLVPVRETRPSGTDFRSPDGRTRIALRHLRVSRSLPEVYEFARQAAGQGVIEYGVLRSDWFVLAGRFDEARYYMRYSSRGDAIAGFFAVFRPPTDEFTTPLTVTSLTMEPFASPPTRRTPFDDDLSSVAEPFRQLQEDAAFAAVSPAPTAPQPPAPSAAAAGDTGSTLWTHNGSTMRLVAEGDRRRIEYVKPRPGLEAAGVTAGTVLFVGRRSGNRIEGRAYTFKAGCPPQPYPVQGVISSETQITLNGPVPLRRNGCEVGDRSASHPDASLGFGWIGPETGGQPAGRTAASQPSTVPVASASAGSASPASAPPPPAPPPPASAEEIEKATTLLSDVQTFVRAQAPMAQVADIALAVASLQAAVEAKSSVAIREESAKLRAVLQKLQGFAAFEAERTATRDAERRKALGNLVQLAQKNMMFIERRIAENVTAPGVKELARIRNETDAAVNANEAGRLQDAIRQLAGFVEQNNLQEDYERFLNAESPDRGGTDSRTPASAKAQFLSEGGPDDLLVLYNASATAPHVAKNLDGALSYESGQAFLCTASGSPADTLSPQLKFSGVLPAGVQTTVDPAPCTFAEFFRHDLFVMSVDDARRLPSFKKERLLSAVDQEDLRHLRTLKKSELDALERARQTRAMEIETRLEKGAMTDGFGALIIDPQSTIGCAVDIDDAELHRTLIEQKYENVFFRASRSFSLSVRSPEAAFLGVQRRQCGFVYGSGPQLTRMISSLRRDGRVYEVSPYWFETSEVQQESQRLEAARRELHKAEQDAKAQTEIDKERRKQSGEDKQALQRKLRRENGDRANFFKNQINVEMRLVLDGRDSPVFSSSFFPGFYRSVRDRRANQWEVVKVEPQIEDYGTVDWKGRKLEGVLIRLTVNEKNRIRGEYKDHCIVLGLVSDEEFQVNREPVEADCATGVYRVRTWKLNNAFTSKWNVD